MKFTWMTPKRSSRSSITRSTYIKINPVEEKLQERDIKCIEKRAGMTLEMKLGDFDFSKKLPLQ